MDVLETILRASGGHFGDISGVLGAIFGVFFVMLDSFYLGNQKGAVLVRFWAGLGGHCGGLKVQFRVLEAILGAPGAHLEAVFEVLGVILADS